MKSILVAIDGSDPAGRAVDLGCELARGLGAELAFVHVLDRDEADSPAYQQFARVEHMVDEPPREAGASLPGRARMPELFMQDHETDTAYRGMAEVAGRLLNEAATEARERGVEQVHTFAESGKPAEAIVALAERMQPGLVVLGSRGRGAVEGLFLGSVSRQVLERAPCPCVTVR